MKNLEIKKQLLEICNKLQIDRIAILKKAMDEAQQSANEYGPPKDRYDSYRMQLLSKHEMLGHQLQKAEAEFLAIKKIDLTKESTSVDFGSVVITKSQKFFVSIGIGKLEFEKDIYYAISPNVPIYNTIKNKKKGQEFIFNGIENKIIDLF